MCIRCRREHPFDEPLALCAACAVVTRLEAVAGLRRLGEYLGAWAAFESWLRARPADAV